MVRRIGASVCGSTQVESTADPVAPRADSTISNAARPSQSLVVTVRVLAPLGAIDGVAEALFAETTTLGFRWWPVSRETLRREEAVVETSLGRVAVKRVRRPDGRWETRPEYESCREIARRRNLPVRDVLAALGAELNPEALVLRDE